MSIKCAEPTVSLSSVIAQSPSVAACDLAGETALLHLESGIYYGLDPVGTFIWQCIQEPLPAATILERMLEHYEVDSAQCESDLAALLEQLQSEQLIEIRDASPR